MGAQETRAQLQEIQALENTSLKAGKGFGHKDTHYSIMCNSKKSVTIHVRQQGNIHVSGTIT